MERRLMDDFDILLPFEDVVKKLRLEDEEDIGLMRSRCDAILELARPKAVYKPCPVLAIEDDRVTIGDVVFRSRVMAKNLQDVECVYAYVATCGREADDWSHKEEDPIVALWLDIVKEMILGKAMEQFTTRLAHEQHIDQYATMSPGSGNLNVWPIQQQRELFTLIGSVEEETGVHLTGSCLMLPTKSVSGILYPSDAGFITCVLCTRANCPHRRAPYDPSKSEMLV